MFNFKFLFVILVGICIFIFIDELATAPSRDEWSDLKKPHLMNLPKSKWKKMSEISGEIEIQVGRDEQFLTKSIQAIFYAVASVQNGRKRDRKQMIILT